jgi:hypothetical protein
VPQYSGKEIDTLESDIDERVLELVALVKSYNSAPMDFAHIAQFFTLDVLSQLAFGDKFGYSKISGRHASIPLQHPQLYHEQLQPLQVCPMWPAYI